MSRFTYFIKMNSKQLNQLSVAGGNVDLNIENMPAVVNGVAKQMGVSLRETTITMLDMIVGKYEQLMNNLKELATMRTGYIKDTADGAQKFLSKKILNFYTDLTKVGNDVSSDEIENLFKFYAFVDTIKVVIDGALDLTGAIMAISYKRNLKKNTAEELSALNDTVYTNPAHTAVAPSDVTEPTYENDGFNNVDSNVPLMALDKNSK